MAKAWVGGGARRDLGGGRGDLAVGEAVAGREALEPGEGDRVAFLRPRHFRRGRAHQSRQAADAFLDLMRVDDGRAVGERAAQHPRQRQFAAMGGVDGADDLRQRRSLFVDSEPHARVTDGRRLVPDGLQEPRDPVTLGRRSHQHRHHMAFTQFARQIVEDEVLRRVDVADELLHQRVVVVGELLEHRIARLLLLGKDAGRHLDDGGGRGLAVDEGALEREIDEAGGDAVLPHRNLAQKQGRAGRRLQHLERFAQAPARLVDLVEEQNPRDAELLELAQDDLQRGNLARVGFAHHDGRIADRQGVAHVVDEFDRSGAIEERQTVAHVVDAGDVGLDAHRVASRLRT